MKQSVSLALFCCLQTAPPLGWRPEEQVIIQKKNQKAVQSVLVLQVLQPEEGLGGGITAVDIVILTPVRCHPPVLLPALHRLRHARHLERGKCRTFNYSLSYNLWHFQVHSYVKCTWS